MDSSTHAHLKENQHVAKGIEVFVGGLAPCMTEDKVREVFASCGEILEIRMIKDNKGNTRGYCFVRFLTREAACKAVKEKNGLMVEGRKIGVLPSTNQCSLFLGNLPKDWDADYFETVVCKIFEGVDSVELAISQSDGETSGQKLVNRGFGFVKFSSHAAAARAYRMGSKSDFVFAGNYHPTVEWAEEEPEFDPEESSKVKVAFIRNLPKDVTEDFLEQLFQPCGKIEKVVLSKKSNCQVGFVHFAERSDLDEAVKRLNDKTVQGPNSDQPFKLQVEVARPFDKKKKRARDEPSRPDSIPTCQSNVKKSHLVSPSSYAHMARVAQEPVVADPYEAIVVTLSGPVKDRLLRILRLGLATRYDIDIHCLRSLKQLPESTAISILNQYMLSAADEVDKGTCLARLISKCHTSMGINEVPLHYSRDVIGNLEAVRPEFPRVPARDSSHSSTASFRQHKYTPTMPLPHYSSSPQVGIASVEKASRSPYQSPVSLTSFGAPRMNSPLQDPRAHQPSFDRSPVPLTSHGPPRMSSLLQTARQPQPSRSQVRFDPYTGEPYKFDPFTGEPIVPESVHHRSGSFY